MKCVILAGGDGIRLRPLTETRPKAMLPVAGRPILQHLLSQLKSAGITEVVIVVRYLKVKIIDHFSKPENQEGLKVTFVDQGKENGTGAALLAAKNHIDDTFVAMAGDTITTAENIQKVIMAHKAGARTTVTLGLKKVSNPHNFGVVELSGDRVSLFEEKPKHPKTDLANLSIYCMEPTIFAELESIGKSERGEYEIVSLFLNQKGVIVDGYWKDIAYPWDLLDANEHLLSTMEARTGHIENSTIDGKVIMEPGAKIINSYIEGCVYIGTGSVIGPNAYLKGSNSIGRNCSIGGATTLKNSVIMDNVNAKHLAYIGDSVIGENVNFGSGTQVANYRFDAGHINVMTERGWVNTGKNKLGVFVGDNTKFGVLSCTMPGKLIGSNCWIHSGTIVNKNISSGMRVYTKQPIEMVENKD